MNKLASLSGALVPGPGILRPERQHCSVEKPACFEKLEALSPNTDFLVYVWSGRKWWYEGILMI